MMCAIFASKTLESLEIVAMSSEYIWYGVFNYKIEEAVTLLISNAKEQQYLMKILI